MTSIKLEPIKIAVLDAIITLRINSEGDIFKYDHKKVREYLNSTGDVKKYLITPDLQRKIVWELSEAHIINTDTIVNTEFINNYRLSQDPNYVADNTMPKLFWFNHTDWAYEHCQLNGAISIEDAYKLDGGAIQIKMTRDEARELKNEYILAHKVCLKFNTDNNRLYIAIDATGCWKDLPTIKSESIACKIISYVWKHANKKVSLRQLVNDNIIDKKYINAYISNLLQKNKTIRALHPKLIDQDKHCITFKKYANYTYNELCDLKAELSI